MPFKEPDFLGLAWMSYKSTQNIILGPGSRTRRKMSGERQQALSKNRCKELIQDMLISTGQRELLKRLIQSRLAQSGWTYAMRNKYIEYIKQRGVENVNVSHMVADTVSLGVDMFPEAIKTEIGDILWDFASEYITIDDSAQPSTETDNANCNSELLQYQTKDAKAEPGLGYNVTTPELVLSRTPSPTIPRPLTPQPPIPILQPETLELEDDLIKSEPVSGPEDEGMSSEPEEENEEEEEEADDDEVNMNLHEDSEEELMDV